MIKHTGPLYAKIGRKYISTGKTGADWDAMEQRLKELEPPPLPKIGSRVTFSWDGQNLMGTVKSYKNCADGHFEIQCDDGEEFVLRIDMIKIISND